MALTVHWEQGWAKLRLRASSFAKLRKIFKNFGFELRETSGILGFELRASCFEKIELRFELRLRIFQNTMPNEHDDFKQKGDNRNDKQCNDQCVPEGQKYGRTNCTRGDHKQRNASFCSIPRLHPLLAASLMLPQCVCPIGMIGFISAMRNIQTI
ncbi:hypothetical protein GPALN_010669 [Globodera pallida]|nr:hypothetical protein GPALN_010669 [Globodera pallida]